MMHRFQLLDFYGHGFKFKIKDDINRQRSVLGAFFSLILMVFTLTFLLFGLVKLPESRVAYLHNYTQKNYFDRQDNYEGSRYSTDDSELIIAFKTSDMNRNLGDFSVFIEDDMEGKKV